MRKPKYKKILVNRTVYFAGALARLKKDAGIYFDFLKKSKSEDSSFPSTGYWAGVRLLFPVINSLAYIYYPKYKKAENSQEAVVMFLRNKLKCSHPRLLWYVFRNPLTHTDSLVTIRYGKKKRGWTLSFGPSTLNKDEYIVLDILKLYNDLESFLKRELSKSVDKRHKGIWLDKELVFIKPSKEIKEEFNR